MIKHFTAPVLGDLDVFYFVLDQIVVQEIHIDDLFHRFLVVYNVIKGTSRQKRGHPSFRFRVTALWIEKESFHLFTGALWAFLVFFFGGLFL